MKMKIIILVSVFAVLVGVTVLWHGKTDPSYSDYKDATYVIDGVSTTLVNGYAATEAAPGSASKIVTQYFGNQAMGDLGGGSGADFAFLITQTGGGSGTFYYVVAALKTQNGYMGTNAIFLGDRIAPQTTEIRDGKIVVNYADRKPNEPMTAQPSVNVMKYFRVDEGVLMEATETVLGGA